MSLPLSLLNQSAGAPPSAVYPHSLFAYVDETIVGGGTLVIKHATAAANEPTSDTWIMGLNPVLSFCLEVSSNCTLIIEVTGDGTNFYTLNPVLLTGGINPLVGLSLPGAEVKFTVWNSSAVTPATIQGIMRMGAL